MQYRENRNAGDSLSVLGYGCMRFTRKGNAIDQEKAESEMLAALERGVNYFDTAYIYPGSEVCLGKFIQKYQCRDRLNIATKLPHYMVRKPEDIDKYFNEHLSRLQTDYIDYYLMHMLNDVRTWKKLCGMGIEEWIRKKKESGQIRNIGFSFHGGTRAFRELIDAYDWDFCQIQFNYMDEHSQAGIEGLRYAGKKGVPVIIMEPLRGGRLANLPDAAVNEFKKADAKRTPVDWALRWIWNHEEVTVILSGMNSLSQVEENCRTAEEALPGSLSEEELAVYGKVLKVLSHNKRIECTGCGYCQPCPKGVDIPTCFAIYNASYTDGYFKTLKEYFQCNAMRKEKTGAGMCVKCGKCEKQCPQHLPIRQNLELVRKRMEKPGYRIGTTILGRILKY